MDNKNNFCPVGKEGELCIYGEGVSEGYYNRNELTKKKFVNIISLTSNKIYKTGDLAKYNYDGNIIFLGRIDDQVKVRGYRIE